ncbi:MAG: hypothetical protein JSV44_00890 [Candidatus Zixiibacteriota bacterium]|nr:MAG: hypothetical protein JSV44_00890 [candidate division Zixibacteria bacterium]
MMQRKAKVSYVIAISILSLIALTGTIRADIELPAGTQTKIEFVQDISSKFVKPGDIAPIRLLEPITVGGVVLVKEGAMGSARVVSAESAGKGGKPGEIELELIELEPNGYYKAADDKKIQIETHDGQTIKARGKGKKTLSYIVFFGLLIKGGEGIIPAGQPIPVKVKEDIMIVLE